MDWGKKIIELAEKRNISVTLLGAEMGFGKSYINDVVNNKKPASPLLKAKIIDRIIFEVNIETLIELLPDEVAEAVKRAKNKAEQKRVKMAEKLEENGDQ